MRRIIQVSFIALFALVGISQAKHMDSHTIDERTKPVGQVRVAGTAEAEAALAAAAPKGPRTGEEIYTNLCSSCHMVGLLNAPKPGDKAAWEPIVARGMDDVLAVAKQGKNAMPAMGNCGDWTDEELSSAITYMVEMGN